MYVIIATLYKLIDIYLFLILVWCILSWFPSVQGRGGGTLSKVYDALGTIIEPYVDLFRKLIPSTGGVDFSPMVAMLALILLQWILGVIF